MWGDFLYRVTKIEHVYQKRVYIKIFSLTKKKIPRTTARCQKHGIKKRRYFWKNQIINVKKKKCNVILTDKSSQRHMDGTSVDFDCVL